MKKKTYLLKILVYTANSLKKNIIKKKRRTCIIIIKMIIIK